MIKIGADRFRSRAAASPEFGAGSGGGMNDFSKQLDSIERAVIETRTKLDTVLPHLATKAEVAPVLTALPHLATKAELEAMRTDLIKWIVGAALSSVAAATAITLIASRITWH
jgi:hypothetical protein